MKITIEFDTTNHGFRPTVKHDDREISWRRVDVNLSHDDFPSYVVALLDDHPGSRGLYETIAAGERARTQQGISGYPIPSRDGSSVVASGGDGNMERLRNG